MKIKNLILSLIITVAGLLAVRPASAQPLTLTGTNYFQNFDGITVSNLPAEWSVREGNLTTTSLGNLVAFTVDSGTNIWSATSGKFYDLASVFNNGTNFLGTETNSVQAAATNRCVAVRVTAAFGDTNNTAGGGVAFVLQIANTTGFGSFNIALDFLLLNPQTRSNIWTVEYGFGSTPSSFTSIGSYTAATIAQGGVFGATHKSFSFGGALDNQPGPVWIRIADDTVITPPLLSGGSGSRPLVGIDNFSLSWSTATGTSPVVITTQPHSATNNAGSTAIFTVGETGTAPSTQWYEVIGGVTNQLIDGSNPDGSVITGSSGPTLQISGLLGGESGSYYAKASNTLNTTNSALATLAVIDPVITIPPANQTNVFGDIDFFDVTVVGTQPMDLQWYYNGSLILDVTTNATTTNQTFVYATNSSAWTNPAGFYLVASNSFGKATSSVATATMPFLPPAGLARWDFNSTNSYPVTAPLPSIGSGVASAVTATFYTNFLFVPGAIADPIDFTPGFQNGGWEFQDGPTNGTANKQVGFQYSTSTLGYNNIILTWMERHSATASKYMRVQYSVNGTTFLDGPVITLNEVAYDFCSADLSHIAGINNNPNFAFRIVCEFESTAIGTTNANYVGTTGTYGGGVSGGTIRNDLMTIWASPILTISPSGSNITVSWSNPNYSLQSATNVTGPYTTIESASSPSYTTSAASGRTFYRLVLGAPTISD